MKRPSFSTKSLLARYVDEVNRLSGNRPAVATFLDPATNDPNDHLSVNSLEVESRKEIADYYRWKFQGDQGRVALCIHQVHEYTDVGKKCGIRISYDRPSAKWQFAAATKWEDAYRHRPVPAHGTPPTGSPSHCGVEFKRALKEHTAGQFARRLSAKKYHVF